MTGPSCRLTTRGGPRLGVRGRLMLCMFSIMLTVLLLIWFLVIYVFQPQYNSYIRQELESRVDSLVAMIDTSEDPISSRTFLGLELNPVFWDSVNTAINNGELDVSSCCVDVSDGTFRLVNYVENIHPCLLYDDAQGVGAIGQTNRNSPLAVRLRMQLFRDGSLYQILSSGGLSQMLVGKLSSDGNYAVIMSMGLSQINAAGDVLETLLPLILGACLAVSTVGAFLFSRWFTRPITELSLAAREVASGNYSVRVCVKNNTEIGDLASDFNHMAGEVQHASQLQRDLLANVSHDLRTPLTLIKGYAETIRDLTGSNEEKRNSQLDIIVDETDRLSGLVNSVMELSKVSSGTDAPLPVRFDMGSLCFEVAGLYDGLCEQNGWTLELEADHEALVYADPDMMQRVLHNLLGNATHHLGPDGWFALRCLPLEEGGCRIEVCDHGPGIKPEDLPYLFDRYYRTRSDKGQPGTGLGLSITKAILRSHGYRFGVNSTPGQGSTFWFVMTPPPAEGE